MIYKTKHFHSILKKSNLEDKDLIAACDEMNKGLVDASLGDHLYKKRVAMPGKGKSSSYRTMIGAVIGQKYFFLYMFAKSDKSNVTNQEKLALQEMAKELIGYDDEKLETAIKSGALIPLERPNE
ncbi:TPA: type II toxin-antitoxin system RelE/ParE family toxin [Vibrio cholerae]|nr:type II toxin-antitoxin system RelE/ParE family toxin [Vibrio vulnificus]HDZ9248877.1 type II toxin-antitoxin system RelE/ParE family toxin [Vibrio cholerae]